MKPNFSSGAHHGGRPCCSSSAIATISSALSARAEANCAPISNANPPGMGAQHRSHALRGRDKARGHAPVTKRAEHARSMNLAALSMDVLDQITELFHLHGHCAYEGPREEPVTAL